MRKFCSPLYVWKFSAHFLGYWHIFPTMLLLISNKFITGYSCSFLFVIVQSCNDLNVQQMGMRQNILISDSTSFVVIQGGPVHLGTTRDLVRFRDWEIRKDPHQQEPSTQNYPRTNHVYYSYGRPGWTLNLSFWVGDTRCPNAASILGQHQFDYRSKGMW